MELDGKSIGDWDILAANTNMIIGDVDGDSGFSCVLRIFAGVIIISVTIEGVLKEFFYVDGILREIFQLEGILEEETLVTGRIGV